MQKFTFKLCLDFSKILGSYISLITILSMKITKAIA